MIASIYRQASSFICGGFIFSNNSRPLECASLKQMGVADGSIKLGERWWDKKGDVLMDIAVETSFGLMDSNKCRLNDWTWLLQMNKEIAYTEMIILE